MSFHECFLVKDKNKNVLNYFIFQRKKDIQAYLKKDVKEGDYEKPKGFDTNKYFETSFNIEHISKPILEDENT